MIGNVIKWIVGLTAAYRDLKQAYDYLQDTLKKVHSVTGELSLECTKRELEADALRKEVQAREDLLNVLIDRLEMIVESGRDSTNGTARKLARVAQSAIVEVTEKPEAENAEAA